MADQPQLCGSKAASSGKLEKLSKDLGFKAPRGGKKRGFGWELFFFKGKTYYVFLVIFLGGCLVFLKQRAGLQGQREKFEVRWVARGWGTIFGYFFGGYVSLQLSGVSWEVLFCGRGGLEFYYPFRFNDFSGFLLNKELGFKAGWGFRVWVGGF